MRKLRYGLAGLLIWACAAYTLAQTQQPAALVVEGGTLIDGTGAPSVPNAVVVIQGNKITNVSRKGQISYPAGAQVIQADGKFILPGYWEAESVFKWYVGEAEFNYGVTSVSDIGEGGEITMLYAKAISNEKVHGPRLFTGITRIGALGFDTKTGLESGLTPGQVPTSVDDAHAIARRVLDSGADVVNFQGGNLPIEYYKAV